MYRMFNSHLSVTALAQFHNCFQTATVVMLYNHTILHRTRAGPKSQSEYCHRLRACKKKQNTVWTRFVSIVFSMGINTGMCISHFFSPGGSAHFVKRLSYQRQLVSLLNKRNLTMLGANVGLRQTFDEMRRHARCSVQQPGLKAQR